MVRCTRLPTACDPAAPSHLCLAGLDEVEQLGGRELAIVGARADLAHDAGLRLPMREMFSCVVRIAAATSSWVILVARRAWTRSSSAMTAFSRATSAANVGSAMRRARVWASRFVLIG